MSTISLPFRFDDSGRVALCADSAEELAAFLTSVVGTHRSERVMRPAYGSNVLRHQFDYTGNNDIRRKVKNAVEESLAANLPDSVAKVEVTTRRHRDDDTTLEVNIAFLTTKKEEGAVSFFVNMEQ